MMFWTPERPPALLPEAVVMPAPVGVRPVGPAEGVDFVDEVGGDECTRPRSARRCEPLKRVPL